jgi:hypothetical protein
VVTNNAWISGHQHRSSRALFGKTLEGFLVALDRLGSGLTEEESTKSGSDEGFTAAL